MYKQVIGWDIGGAHLKAVLLADGVATHVLQLPCPLWKGLDHAQLAMQEVLRVFKVEPAEAFHAVTMTGELVDLFPDRKTGVCEIAALCVHLLGEQVRFYAAAHGLVLIEHVPDLMSDIASTNWHASARLVASQTPNALFVDMGSTTTDVIAIEAGRISAGGNTDAERLRDDRLIYTGVVRTPIMALAQKLPFEGAHVNVAAEYFATMADVYRLTGELSIADDMADTADGAGKTPLESARRLARMIGHDVSDAPFEAWLTLAKHCKHLQMQQVQHALNKFLKPNMTIISAGAGSFLVHQIAANLNSERALSSASSLYNKHVCKQVTMRLAEQVDAHALAMCFSAYAVASYAFTNEAQHA